jgi:hypothetical protein
MKKEIIGEKEVNLSHDISGRKNVRKENRDLYEYYNPGHFINSQKKIA